jgi:hypothetical protein
VCCDGVCCTPEGAGKACGDDQCGGYCGNGAPVSEGCPAFQECHPDDFLCEFFSVPDLCGDKQCGADGVGDVCGTCPCPECSPAATKCEGFECTVALGLECHEIFDCFGGCMSGDQACYVDCITDGTAQAEVLYNNFIQCLDTVGYFDCPDGDDECLDTTIGLCMDEYYACFHGDEPCSVLYVCLVGCPGGDSGCTGDCFTNATIDALNVWDLFIDCLDSAGYYECLPGDSECTNAAWDACDVQFKACAQGELNCKEVFGCIQGCDPWDSVCRIGCRIQGTLQAQEAIDEIAACVEEFCVPVTGTCEQQVLVDECADVYGACLAE